MAKAFEHPKPAASWETRAYWEGCGRRRARAAALRCLRDGAASPPRGVRALPLGRDRALRRFGSRQVYTYTVTHQNGVPPFRDAVPYVLAYVELEEGPRLMTNIVGCEPTDVEIGMPVVVDFADVDASDLGAAGGAFAVPRFRPA